MKNSKCYNKKAFSLIEISIVILIIGILIAGVASGSRLIYKSKLSAAQNLTRKSAVAEIDNLSLWFETTLENSFINTNDNLNIKNKDKIKTWKNINPQISIKSNAVQTTPANSQPVYIKNGINGLPSVYFDADNGNNNGDILEVANQVDFASSQVTIFVVEQVRLATSNYGVLLHNRSKNPNTAGYLFWKMSDNRFSAWYETNEFGTVSVSDNSALTVGQSNIYSMIIQDSNYVLYKNGVQKALNNQYTYKYPTSGGSPTPYFCIGADRNGGTVFSPGSYYNGYVGEIIIYSRFLDTDERQDVEKYLAKKWSIALN